jgi:hypothetical protein
MSLKRFISIQILIRLINLSELLSFMSVFLVSFHSKGDYRNDC